eukprot:361518-Chlamydomonas_euryale.AAC.4
MGRADLVPQTTCGRWAVGGGLRAVGSGLWAAGGGLWAVGSCSLSDLALVCAAGRDAKKYSAVPPVHLPPRLHAPL